MLKGLTQAQVSELSGLSQARVSRVERGELNVELGTVQAVAASLDAELVIVPRAALREVKSAIEEHLGRGAGPRAPLPGGVMDELFIPDDEEPAMSVPRRPGVAR